MGLSQYFRLSVLPVLLLTPNLSFAKVSEPQKLASPTKLKPGEGVVRLSVRTQKQFTETFFLYFVRLDEAGSDTDSFVRIERGAGVPLAGSNMIDPKPLTYRSRRAGTAFSAIRCAVKACLSRVLYAWAR